MKTAPRLLPLVAVAIGGVLAVKALSGAEIAPQLFSGPTANAEEAPKPKPAKPSAAVASSAAKAPVCALSAAELAREAGMSPGELETLQSLGARRGQLDERERALDTQIQLLAAAETKVDAKIKALNDLKAQVQALLGQADQKQQAEVDRLVVVYSKMKPREAAPVMATLDDRVRVPVAAGMKPAILAAILGQMPTEEAKKLTESLAHRFAGAQALAQVATQAPAPDPAQAQAAQAQGASADATQASKAQPAAKPRRRVRRPVKIARAAARPAEAADDSAQPAPAPAKPAAGKVKPAAKPTPPAGAAAPAAKG